MPKLSDTQAAKLKPGDHSCSVTGGFFLRVSKTGTRTWMVRGDLYAPGPKRSKRAFIRQVKKALGRYPEMNTEDARAEALAFLKRLRAGEDPQVRAVITLGDAWDAKLDDYRNARTAAEFKRRKSYLGKLVDRPLTSITTQEIEKLLKAVAENNGESMADGLLTDIKIAINFQIKRGLNMFNPARPIRKYNPPSTREHFTPRDIARMWADWEQDKNLQRAGVLRLMYLTGLRFGNARRIKLEHIDFDEHRIVIPKTKAGRRFYCPMSPEIEDVVREAMKHTRPNNPFLFPADSAEGCLVVSDFYNHGLRHFYSTQAEIAINNPQLVEILLDHTLQGMKRIYTHPETIFPDLLKHQKTISKLLMSFTKEAREVASEALLV